MPPIDPERLLRTLSPLLDHDSGAIRSVNEVDKLYGLMAKFSKKLVSKVIYLNILKATPTDVLDLFMQRGGWDMVCSWATEGLSNKNWSFLKVVTELLLLTPTTVVRLKDNDLPKIIKSLSKECEDEEMRTAAGQVYDKWMLIAQQKEVARYIGADGQPISIEDNLAEYELQSTTVPISIVTENQIILEADPTSGTFDLTQYIDATDLNNLETDFNPDDFHSTVEEHLMDGTELVDGDALLQQDANSINQASGTFGTTEGSDSLSQLVRPMSLQATDTERGPLCIVVKDGKRFLLRLQGAIPTENSNVPVGIPEKKPQSAGKPKMPPSGKPKMPTSGKPPLKAYEAKAKKANTSDAKLNKGIPNFYGKDKGNKDKEDESSKDKDRQKARTKLKELEKKKQQSVVSASRAAIEAKRRLEEEKTEKLRLKVLEQKRIRDQRKEEQAKKQKEIDDETLKALRLTAQPPTKIPKIPKKAPSFADMIATNSKDKEAKKVTQSTNKLSKDKGKESPSLPVKDKKDEDLTTRRSRPKVYVSGKSRSLGLLEEMEQAQAKGKEKEKPVVKDEAVDKDSDVLPTSKKTSKRTSSENSIESPSKKPKKEPPPKKVVVLQESSLFMDALNSATTTRTTRSSKRRASDASATTKVETPTTPIKSPDETKPVVFNFYRDTLGDNDDKESEDTERRASASTINSEDKDEIELDVPVDAFVPAEGEGLLKSNLVLHRPKDKPKKNVRWVDDAELKKFYYFEMDETERINVTRGAPRNFSEMKLIERSEERKVLKRNLRKDNMEEKIPWTTPRPIIFKTPPLETGGYSYEVGVQAERESLTLGVVYFSNVPLPDSATEPDEPTIKNQDDPSILKQIPFDDIPGVTQFQSYVFKAPVVEPRVRGGPPNSFGEGPKPNPNDFLPNMNYHQQPPQMPPIDMAQAQYNLWNTLGQVPTAAAAAAVAAAGIAPGSEMWNQFQLATAAGLQQAAAAQGLTALAAGGLPNFPFGYPPAVTPQPPGYNTNAVGMIPNTQQSPLNQFGPPGNPRFSGPPPGRGGGRDNRSGRPNRWDDRGNYDERRRDGDRNRNNDRDRDKSRGYGDRGRDREFHRNERNRQGIPRTVLCKFYQQGCCKLGEECDFLHPGINGPSRPPSRFTSRFSSPPPSSSRNIGRVESPDSKNTADDDNWDAPEPSTTVVTESRKTTENSFEQPPSSPTQDERPAIDKPPRMIPVTESEPMDYK